MRSKLPILLAILCTVFLVKSLVASGTEEPASGALVTDATKSVIEIGLRYNGDRIDFFIDDISAEVDRLRGLDKTKEAVQRRLDMAYDWQIFADGHYHEVWEILRPDQVNVLDLSVIAQGRYGLRRSRLVLFP